MMPMDLLQRLPRPRRSSAEWLALAGILVLSALMVTYFIWNERRLLIASDIERMRMRTLIINENLQQQFDGVRNALDSARRVFHPNADCTGNCRQVLLQSLKRAMPGVRAMVATIAAMAEGRVRVFIGLGGNFAVATPDTPHTFAALRSSALTSVSPPSSIAASWCMGARR